MSKVIVIESIGSGYMHECHKLNCRDVAKKAHLLDNMNMVYDNMADAKEAYEEDNETFESESGEGAGYYWSDVKIYPCATGAAA